MRDIDPDWPPGEIMVRLIQKAENARGWEHIQATGLVLARADMLTTVVILRKNAPQELAAEIGEWKDRGYPLNEFFRFVAQGT